MDHVQKMYGTDKVITLSYNGQEKQRWLWSDANLARAIKEANLLVKHMGIDEVTITHPNLLNPIIKITR